jgi:hypothetical protein
VQKAGFEVQKAGFEVQKAGLLPEEPFAATTVTR